MKIDRLILYATRIPMRTEFRHALKSRKTSQSVIVEVVTASGVHGYGEGTPRGYVTGESLEGTIARISSVAATLKEEHWADAEGEDLFSRRLAALNLNVTPSARCALELALMDAWGKYTGRPVAAVLGSGLQRDRVCFSGVVSGGNLAATEALLQQIQRLGFRQVKLKVDNDHALDLDRLALAKRILGPDIELRIDANGAWELSEAVENIGRFASMGIVIVEQPLAVAAREDYPRLMEQVGGNGVQIIADESVASKDDALWLIRNKGISGFNLKISKHGGLRPTWQIYQMARKAGLTCRLGCHVGETALLTAAGRCFAAIAGALKSHEGSFGRFLLEYDITREDMTFGPGGDADLSSVLSRNGLGVAVDEALLARASQVEGK